MVVSLVLAIHTKVACPENRYMNRVFSCVFGLFGPADTEALRHVRLFAYRWIHQVGTQGQDPVLPFPVFLVFTQPACRGCCRPLSGVFPSTLACGASFRPNSVIGNRLQSRLKDLKLGKGRVFEDGFSMVIGWNDKVLPLVDQVRHRAYLPLSSRPERAFHAVEASIAMGSSIKHSCHVMQTSDCGRMHHSSPWPTNRLGVV